MAQTRAPRSTRVAIWQSELTSGSALPRICVVTGRPADGWRQYGFPIPPRLGVLLPLAFAMGMVAGLLGAHGATMVLGGGEVIGTLPVAAGAPRLRARVGGVLLLALVGIVVLVALAVAAGGSGNDTLASDALLAACACIVVVVVSVVIAVRSMPHGRVRAALDGEPWVLVRGVHPRFARAVTLLPRPRPDARPTGLGRPG